MAWRRRHNGAHQNGMSKIGAGRVTAGGQRRLTSGTKPRRGFWHWPACRMVYAAAPAGCHGGIWHGKSGRDRVWYHTWAKVWRMLALGIARLTGRRTASAPGQGPRRLHIAAQQNGVVAAPLRRICGGTSHCIRAQTPAPPRNQIQGSAQESIWGGAHWTRCVCLQGWRPDAIRARPAPTSRVLDKMPRTCQTRTRMMAAGSKLQRQRRFFCIRASNSLRPHYSRVKTLWPL